MAEAPNPADEHVQELVEVVNVAGEDGVTIMFLCPGCDDDVHAVNTRPGMWTWNGSTTAPTFTPSVFVNRGQAHPGRPVCHSFVTDGGIRYLADCTHPLASQTVRIPPWAERRA